MTIQLYAPGDGALSFTKTANQYVGNCRQDVATGEPITREEAEARVAEEGDRFKDYLLIEIGKDQSYTRMVEAPRKKWARRADPPEMVEELVLVPPQFRLCAPVKRVGDNKLQLNGTVYTYAVDESNIFWSRDGEYTDNNLSITFHHCIVAEGETLVDEPDRELRNVSTRGALRWFLNHEAIILKQYPQQDSTLDATTQTLKETVASLRRAGMSDEQIIGLTNE